MVDSVRRRQWRGDCTFVDAEHGANEEKYVYTNDLFIDVPEDAEEPVAVYSSRHLQRGRSMPVPDPRLLGLVAWFFEANHGSGKRSMTSSSCADRKNLRVEAATADGEPVWKVTSQVVWAGRDATTSMEYWVSPKTGWLPLHRESAYRQADYVGGATLTSRLAWNSPAGIWFPRETDFVHSTRGKVDAHEVVIVEEAQLGDPAAPEVFTLAGLGLPDGRRVIDVDFVMKVWRDGRLRADAAAFAVGDSGERTLRRYWVLLANAVVLAAVGAWLLLRRRRRAAR